ncbi:MAG: NFACT RNA binding domain-containing protein [Lachnospiraceae bacterium]|nr:NFACT RNA binding domain-containing protein [Lachnospiraceae bacterium]
MALDGITVNSIVCELTDKLLGGRIDKIYQPQKDEIIISVRSIGSNFKLLMSANPSHPRLQLTSVSKDNPMTPPMFCMVLRKHVAGSKITNIYQPNFERVVVLELDSLNEMGDMTTKRLIIEIMGKHSNIILVDEKNKILDSIKHVSHETSSVREVLPGKEYSVPPSQGKLNPQQLNEAEFLQVFSEKSSLKLQNIIYQSYTGISPVIASEICQRASLDATIHCEQLDIDGRRSLFSAFTSIMDSVKTANFSPEIIYENKTGRILDFSPVEMTQYSSFKKVPYSSISELLESFYSQRDNVYHIKQKAHDMRRLVVSNIERCVKKKEIQIKTLKDNEGLEKWKLKGELLTANIYAIEKGMNTIKLVNYYEEDMPEIEIALDTTKTPSENAQKYYNKYNKAKRTIAALEIQKKQNDDELVYLEGVLNAIDASTEEADLNDIRNELIEQGFIKRKRGDKKPAKQQKKSKPLHFISSDGFDIYVGKSNIQNDELTIHFAKSNDIWLHTKNIPGSHVIIATNDATLVPDQTIIEAANLAAYSSKGQDGSNVPVDYCPRKNVKKPGGSKPGFVIYENNKTIYITPNDVMAENMKKA